MKGYELGADQVSSYEAYLLLVHEEDTLSTFKSQPTSVCTV